MLTVDDRVAISQHLARYGNAIDLSDWDTVASIFTDDAVVDLSLLGIGSYEGKKAILDHFKEPRLFATAHLFTNVTVDEVDGEVVLRARALNPDPEGRMLVCMIKDVMTETKDGWRVAHRTVTDFLRPGPSVSRES
jgi:ketosteroid isomerase-like protein